MKLEEEEAKSAFEIAMERISGLPRLTPEEITEQKEKEFKPIGQALCNKYLQNQIMEDELRAELSGCKGEKQDIVRRALIAGLCGSIQLEDIPKAEKALSGLALLAAEDADFRETLQKEFFRILRDYDSVRNIECKKYDDIIRGELEHAGIRGSAVKPNPAANEGWLRSLSALRRAYEPRLDDLKIKAMARLAQPN
jgi:hypothetical protein